ncbi:hypothetical protein [Promicromonospora aerolata]|uniref:Uncharacterized protein n=1 Tax=Promicromonospora aerolata TaxID=195749 RepID=A0ABW4VAN0_9MICO
MAYQGERREPLTGLASPAADAVAITALPVTVLFAVVMLRRFAVRAAPAAAVVVLGAVLVLSAPEPASAHDPGQGKDVGPATITAEVSGRQITMSTAVAEHCDDLVPRGLVARRTGEEVTADLRQTGDGFDFEGTLEVPSTGRWFTDAELTHDGTLVEAWLPAIAGGELPRTTQVKALYEPAGTGDRVPRRRVVSGGPIYGLGAAVVVVALRAVQRPVTMIP